MHTLGTVVLFAGVFVAIFAQVYAAAKIFKSSIVKGLLCLTIPGYVLVAAKRLNFYGRLLGIWLSGIVGMVLGTIMLT